MDLADYILALLFSNTAIVSGLLNPSLPPILTIIDSNISPAMAFLTSLIYTCRGKYKSIASYTARSLDLREQ